MSVTTVVINGTTRVGKSTTLQALGAILTERGQPHALVDFDHLSLAPGRRPMTIPSTIASAYATWRMWQPIFAPQESIASR